MGVRLGLFPETGILGQGWVSSLRARVSKDRILSNLQIRNLKVGNPPASCLFPVAPTLCNLPSAKVIRVRLVLLVAPA